MKRLTKQELAARKKKHEKRAAFYERKLKEIEESEKRIGFKWY